MEPEPTNEQRRKKSNRSPPYALFNLLVIVVAIIYGAYYQMYINKDATKVDEVVEGEDDLIKIPLFTAEQLKQFDGVSEYPSSSHVNWRSLRRCKVLEWDRRKLLIS